MKLLLDTHALLWWLSDDRRLGQGPRTLIADPGNDILVSVVWPEVTERRSAAHKRTKLERRGLALAPNQRFTPAWQIGRVLARVSANT